MMDAIWMLWCEHLSITTWTIRSCWVYWGHHALKLLSQLQVSQLFLFYCVYWWGANDSMVLVQSNRTNYYAPQLCRREFSLYTLLKMCSQNILSFTFTSRFVDYICVYVYSGVTSVYVFALESIKPMLYVCECVFCNHNFKFEAAHAEQCIDI